VRLEQGREEATDSPENSKYTRSAATYRQWRAGGVLQAEAQPVVYIYDQTFDYNRRGYRRRSLMVAVRLEPWEKGVVLPHEQTMPRPKSDRLSLMRACRAAFSPLLALYEDPGGVVGQTLARYAQSAPEATFSDEYGEGHTLWVIDNPDIIERIVQTMTSSPIYMADGHHRYETALAYRDERRNSETGSGPDAPFEFVMMALESVDDSGMLILPTHRLVAGPPAMSTPDLLAQLGRWFTIKKMDGGAPDTVRGVLDAAAPTGAAVFLLAVVGEAGMYRLELHEPAVLRALMPPGRCAAWQELDVSVLQTAIIERILRIPHSDPSLTFTRDEREALEAVREGKAWLALFLRPTQLEQLRQVALAGDRMPEKSTYFYPKLLSGLVMYDLG
jgi:uncharacterized protein (DUF1015 family)